jgi:formylglycine-generating enzyme required for sulfatase activity
LFNFNSPQLPIGKLPHHFLQGGETAFMKRAWIVFIIALFAVMPACGAEQTATPAAKPSTGTDSSAPTRELLGATAAATRIPVTPTATPVTLPPTPTPRPSPTPAADQAQAAQKFKPVTEMVEIPAGAFTMGRSDGPENEGPAHSVDLPSFYIEIFEVTNAQFVAFTQDSGYVTDAEKGGGTGWRAYINGKDNHPAVKISWNDAQAYCQWAGRRLPTEAEWEKAARGAQDVLYPWGNNFDARNANVKESGYRGTTPVGTFAAGTSPYGVFDMAGNVWEWTVDWYQPYPGNNTPDDFYGEKFKVLRGGGWFDEPDQVLVTNRSSTSPEAANDDIGFRCAADRP